MLVTVFFKDPATAHVIARLRKDGFEYFELKYPDCANNRPIQ